MFKLVARVLMAKGVDIYSIGQHKGLCTTPYVVIKENTDNSTISKNINRGIVDLHIYYPIGSYSKVMPYIESVLNIMDNIAELKPVYDGVPIITDDEKQAYTTRLSYQILKKRRF